MAYFRLSVLAGRRSTPGVQQAVRYLAAHGMLEEAAESFSRLLPLQMSARQGLTLMQPVGEALMAGEDAPVQHLWQQAAQARTDAAAIPSRQEEELERLYIELDGVTARLRCHSVPMEEKEEQRAGDVYREVKVAAVFEATPGPERSGLAPGVFVDEAAQKHYLARHCSAEAFGKLLLSGKWPTLMTLVSSLTQPLAPRKAPPGRNHQSSTAPERWPPSEPQATRETTWPVTAPPWYPSTGRASRQAD